MTAEGSLPLCDSGLGTKFLLGKEKREWVSSGRNTSALVKQNIGYELWLSTQGSRKIFAWKSWSRLQHIYWWHICDYLLLSIFTSDVIVCIFKWLWAMYWTAHTWEPRCSIPTQLSKEPSRVKLCLQVNTMWHEHLLSQFWELSIEGKPCCVRTGLPHHPDQQKCKQNKEWAITVIASLNHCLYYRISWVFCDAGILTHCRCAGELVASNTFSIIASKVRDFWTVG